MRGKSKTERNKQENIQKNLDRVAVLDRRPQKKGRRIAGLRGGEIEPEWKQRQVSNTDERKYQDSIRPLRPRLRRLGGLHFYGSRAITHSPFILSLTRLSIPPVRVVVSAKVLTSQLLVIVGQEHSHFCGRS